MLRTNWGLVLALVVVFISACGDVELKESAALTRGTDVTAALPDAGQPTMPDAGGTGGMTGSGGAVVGTGGAGAGGSGSGGAGIGGVTGAGGAGADYTCADLLACCDSLTGSSQAQLRAQCLAAYSSATTGTTSCGSALAMIKINGLCP